MAIIKEHLQLNKQFLIIDSPVPFTLIANNGTDEVYRMAGAWQIDTHKLLPEKYQKQYPVFNLDLVYDNTNLGNGVVTVRESNIDIGDGISGVNGQDVKVTNFNELIPYLDNLKKKVLFANVKTFDELKNVLSNFVLSEYIDNNVVHQYYNLTIIYMHNFKYIYGGNTESGQDILFNVVNKQNSIFGIELDNDNNKAYLLLLDYTINNGYSYNINRCELLLEYDYTNICIQDN